MRLAARSAAGDFAPINQRVVFVNRFYAPDESATSQMLTDLAEALVRSGVEVEVFCSRQLYGDAAANLPATEVLRGVRVRRLATTRFGRDSLAGRAIDYATFYLGATISLLARIHRGDVLVVKTDPPLLSLIGSFAARCRGARLVNWLQDLYPEVASRLALSPVPRAAEALVRAARDRSLATARINVVLGTRMREYLLGRGIAAARISICENWADESRLRPLAPGRSELRGKLGLDGEFVAAYSGNLGRAHDVTTIFDAGCALASEPGIKFLMVGGGAGMRALELQARARSLANFRFAPYQPREALSDSLAAGDVHLVSLRPELEGLIVPSKLYGILAAGRPVVFIGDPDGELARLIAATEVGISVGSGDSAGLCCALRALRDDEAGRARMGARARAIFEERYTLAAAVARWRDVLAAAGA
ncbi:MAG TPA: glycosyltransferase family 4 protein [Steroidobacteraceae bacterium]|nr:glycosyltransferase family 4 protein [Steroidobacteraceae bacterium]